MPTITLEVPNDIAKKFENQKIVKYKEIIECDDNLHYNFKEEKISLEELSSFLWKIISSKKEEKC